MAVPRLIATISAFLYLVDAAADVPLPGPQTTQVVGNEKLWVRNRSHRSKVGGFGEARRRRETFPLAANTQDCVLLLLKGRDADQVLNNIGLPARRQCGIDYVHSPLNESKTYYVLELRSNAFDMRQRASASDCSRPGICGGRRGSAARVQLQAFGCST